MPHTRQQIISDVNSLVIRHLKTRQKQAAALHQDYEFLWRAIVQLQSAGGKRLRPYLFVSMYEALGGEEYEYILPVAASLELLHVSLLIHDDVIDRDTTRRGVKNINGEYADRYKNLLAVGVDTVHLAHSAGIIAGDLVLSEAYRLLAASVLPQTEKTKLIDLLGEAAFVVGGGQLLDTEAVAFPYERANSLLIAELKTAFYSFTTPLIMAGMLTSADSMILNKLKKLGTNLGIAFQLADDLEDIFVSSRQTGKSKGGDIREGKRTYLLQHTLQLASTSQKKQLQAMLGNPNLDTAGLRDVRQIMTDCGARADTEKLTAQYITNAQKTLQSLPINQTAKDSFALFIEQTTNQS